jgi:hypothetical protein
VADQDKIIIGLQRTPKVICIPNPRTSKKQGNRQADGGGQAFHTGKSDRVHLSWEVQLDAVPWQQ